MKTRINRSATAMLLAVVLVICLCLSGCAPQVVGVDYSKAENWAYLPLNENITKDCDVFFVAPTVYLGTADAHSMDLGDEETKAQFLGATNMEKGLYDGDTNFFAPYYRQAALNAYTMEDTAAAPYFDVAYADVATAFDRYLKDYNQGRPFILAGFSQGSEMLLRLMAEKFDDPTLNDQLVAAYLIGWRVTPEDLNNYPFLKMAQHSGDTGVIISFNSEAEGIQSSLIVPDQTLGINPLNWKTDSTPAAASENKGAVFTDYTGGIVKEVPNLTGAYLDPVRGTLRVSDVTPADFPPVLDIFQEGVYHLYDYQFFYRNLQENVKERIGNYLS
ncbi:DUF3089 domain-containing protein [Acetobacterium woodii]|uniref:DUF3089 domain-containing protein n=1 Tax=Acetobacterium woodii (strain ATCC 29683 / DSM 1030 / JCM 2381 / KCTC 1655 / WB1) TaxID=931626 RepID=H6LJP5_ACEWD|nr:DUF3089 domain-containing protein [Acetobacterium woodii]AFA47446.1 hypothetical protein Awo_c06520 [Acetobacterium woodii DSM 1030]